MAPNRLRAGLAGGAALLAAMLGGVPASAATGQASAATGPAAVGTALPTAETPPVFDDERGGNGDADSPIVWVNPRKSSASLVIGTLKDAGLAVYDLSGRQLQHLAAPPKPGKGDKPGRLNNVDVLYGVQTGAGRQDLAVVTDRGRDQLRVYRIDAKAAGAGKPPLTDVTDPSAPFVFSADQAEVNGQDTAYGIAAFQRGGTPYVLATREHTTGLGLVQLVAKGKKMSYRTVRTVDLPSRFTLPDGSAFTPCEDPGEGPQSEGMVVDAASGVAYVAQEDVGVWRLDATLTNFAPRLVDGVREFGVPAVFDPVQEECVAGGPDPGAGGEHLSADVEGLTIYHGGAGAGYLLASSQGDSTFAVYDLAGANPFLGSFRVGAAGNGVDGVEETDSLTVTNVPVGPFRQGLAVFADGDNSPAVTGPDGEPRKNTDFKLVPWENVAGALVPPLDIDTGGFDPRDR